MAAGYHDGVAEFLRKDTSAIVGMLADRIAEKGIVNQKSMQIKVWGRQVSLLKDVLTSLSSTIPLIGHAHIVLEFEIPRRQKRPDVIILYGDAVVVIEFKFDAERFDSASRWQVQDYILNLRDFHEGSAGRKLIPILCATNAPQTAILPLDLPLGETLEPLLCNASGLEQALDLALSTSNPCASVGVQNWLESDYRPCPTIIEAAERLYGNQTVRELSHSYADNLTVTTDMVAETVRRAREQKEHILCFVTGVPGAGKTLTGLNIVHDPTIRSKDGPSGIFLSGNGPLVKVIREALTRNAQKAGAKRKDAAHEVSTFIQNVHQFLEHYRENPSARPHEHVVIFDEAQRAWDKTQMLKKRGVDASEATLLIETMERFDDWGVIIALVGGGQEIFLGEAGISEWGRAISTAKRTWSVVASPEVLTGGSSVAGQKLWEDNPPRHVPFRAEKSAHLTVSVRSFRAQQLAAWVNCVVGLEKEQARAHVPNLVEFPIVVTRSLEATRAWLRLRSLSDPAVRPGLVASSEDQRLRAYGLERSSGFRSAFPFEKWFLECPPDCRSSHSLEVAASEFECQGLELDWVGLCWGGDLTIGDVGDWAFRKFRGSKWQRCKLPVEQNYILNRYRVLLTRARSGLIIWVPKGNPDDPTLTSRPLDRTYNYLLDCGIPALADDTELDHEAVSPLLEPASSI